MSVCILVVDDDEIYRVVLKTALTRKGYVVATAAGIGQAQEALNKFTPDLIILDVMMPDGNGLDFCAALRQSKFTRSVPVIIFSANDTPNSRQQSLLVGANVFVSKSETHTRVLGEVQVLLDEHRSIFKPHNTIGDYLN